MTKDNELRKVAEQHVRRFALLYHFLSREIIENLGEEKGKILIRNAIKKFGEARGKSIRNKVKDAGLELNLKNFKEYYDLPLGLTHESVKIKSSSERKSWKEVRGCLFSEVIKQLKSEDAGALFCEQDKVMALAYNSEIIFTRIQTTLTGGDCCETIMELKD